MTPRNDGMPEGHPEHIPTQVAVATLHAVAVGAGDDLTLTGQLLVHVSPPPGTDRDAYGDQIRDLLRSMLAQDPACAVEAYWCRGCGTLHLKDSDDAEAGGGD